MDDDEFCALGTLHRQTAKPPLQESTLSIANETANLSIKKSTKSKKSKKTSPSAPRTKKVRTENVSSCSDSASDSEKENQVRDNPTVVHGTRILEKGSSGAARLSASHYKLGVVSRKFAQYGETSSDSDLDLPSAPKGSKQSHQQNQNQENTKFQTELQTTFRKGKDFQAFLKHHQLPLPAKDIKKSFDPNLNFIKTILQCREMISAPYELTLLDRLQAVRPQHRGRIIVELNNLAIQDRKGKFSLPQMLVTITKAPLRIDPNASSSGALTEEQLKTQKELKRKILVLTNLREWIQAINEFAKSNEKEMVDFHNKNLNKQITTDTIQFRHEDLKDSKDDLKGRNNQKTEDIYRSIVLNEVMPKGLLANLTRVKKCERQIAQIVEQLPGKKPWLERNEHENRL